MTKSIYALTKLTGFATECLGMPDMTRGQIAFLTALHQEHAIKIVAECNEISEADAKSIIDAVNTQEIQAANENKKASTSTLEGA